MMSTTEIMWLKHLMSLLVPVLTLIVHVQVFALALLVHILALLSSSFLLFLRHVPPTHILGVLPYNNKFWLQ